MNLATIEIDPTVAEERLSEYRESLRHDRNAEDERMAKAYAAAAKGLPVLRLSDAVEHGGWFSNGLPRIAVVRADATRCIVQISRTQHRSDAEVLFHADERRRNLGAMVGEQTVRTRVPDPGMYGRAVRFSGETMVPPVPPKFRPRRSRLHLFHILWEVEKWDPTPPKDPALLRHIGGDLWSVHAVWDLTELERAVITGTR